MSKHPPVVYIVDDDPSVRKSLHRLLAVAGFSSLDYGSAQEYLVAEHDNSGPSCLILDVRLPGLNGLELQRRLAENRSAPPIVFITGHGDIPMSVKAIKAGAVDFLSKPFSDEELLNAVEQALEKSRSANARMMQIADICRRLDSLTQRERQVLHFVVMGRLNKQIAAEMNITEKTVKVHRSQVMHKMGVGSVADLVRVVERAKQNGQE